MVERDENRHCTTCYIEVTGNLNRHTHCKKQKRLANDHQAAVSEGSRGNYSNLISLVENS